MGQVCPFDTAEREAHAREISRAAGTGIENECAVACDQAEAGACAQRVWQGRAGAAHEDMQAVRQLCAGVASDIGLDGVQESCLCDLGLEDLKPDQGHVDGGVPFNIRACRGAVQRQALRKVAENAHKNYTDAVDKNEKMWAG